MRSLTGREIATLRAALYLWRAMPAAAMPPECYDLYQPPAGFLSDEQIAALIEELGAVAVTLASSAPVQDEAARTWPESRSER